MKIVNLACMILLLSACASSLDTRLSLPYSERTDIIHAYEAINFEPVDKGEKNIILFFKSASAETLAQYRSFDTNVITQSNVVYKSLNQRRATAHMREYIQQKLHQHHYKLQEKSLSQAGIAITISSYQKVLGRNIEELMMVVFDRKKASQLSLQTPELKGYQLLKQTAVWVGVVRQIPSIQSDISTAVHTMLDEDFRRMVDLMFEAFMKDSHYIPLG